MSDENEISIEGLDEAAVLAALHNNTRPQGMGFLHDLARDMTISEARKALDALPRDERGVRFDYFHGRPLKVRIGEGKVSGVRLYDRDAGQGACSEAIESVRRGLVAP